MDQFHAVSRETPENNRKRATGKERGTGMSRPDAAHAEMLTEIRVECDEAVSVRGQETTVVMIPFTGIAEGPCFRGKTAGIGMDTQQIGKDGNARLSARYMLEGTDAAGNTCRIFVENQGSEAEGFTPRIVTDSPLLKEWETAELGASVEGIPGGVRVRIFRRTGE